MFIMSTYYILCHFNKLRIVYYIHGKKIKAIRCQEFEEGSRGLEKFMVGDAFVHVKWVIYALGICDITNAIFEA